MKLFGFSITGHFWSSLNHYDRLVHFLYGSLVAPAVMELLAARGQLRDARRLPPPMPEGVAHSRREYRHSECHQHKYDTGSHPERIRAAALQPGHQALEQGIRAECSQQPVFGLG